MSGRSKRKIEHEEDYEKKEEEKEEEEEDEDGYEEEYKYEKEIEEKEAMKKKRRMKIESEGGRGEVERSFSSSSSPSIKEDKQVGLKGIVQALDKKWSKNQTQRMKYPGEPHMFMQSELELHEEIIHFRNQVMNFDNLYGLLVRNEVKTKFLELLMGLLNHENMDVMYDTITLLNEVSEFTLQEDVSEEDEEQILAFIRFFYIENSLLKLLVDELLSKLLKEESDQGIQAVYHTLQIIENLTEINPELSLYLCNETSLLQFLLNRVQVNEFTENKLYASEVLSIMLQPGTLQMCREVNLESILKAISYYRKRNPSNTEEKECIENLFNAVCNCLFLGHYQTMFRSIEGFELMFKCMKEKKYSRECAIRVLNYALMNNTRNCNEMILVGGLKYIFPVFMGSAMKKVKATDEQNTMEFHIVSVLANLMSLCSFDTEEMVYERLQAKFMENDHEKLDRLVELYEKYSHLLKSSPLESEANERFTLQQICFLMAHVASISSKVKDYLVRKLNERDLNRQDIGKILKEYAEEIEVGEEENLNDPEIKPKFTLSVESSKMIELKKKTLEELATII